MTMNTHLVRYEAARQALAEAHRIDEVKDIRDKAEAMAAYARQAKDTELVQWATEIKVRAERRCGELLTETEKRNGGHAMKARSHDATEVPPSLADIGLTKDQSSRYQRLAAMPEEHFETAIATAKSEQNALVAADYAVLLSALGFLLRPGRVERLLKIAEGQGVRVPEDLA